jgi:hypothetical protein
MWKMFDKENLPADGDYIARTVVRGRVDNPHYTKLVVRNGKCPNNNIDVVTHYMKDPGWVMNIHTTKEEKEEDAAEETLAPVRLAVVEV